MPLTRNFKDTVKARAEALEALLSDDLETGKVLLRDYVNATVGFEALAAELDKSPKSLMRMLSDKGNPRAGNLLGMVGHLKKREGVALSVSTAAEGLHA